MPLFHSSFCASAIPALAYLYPSLGLMVTYHCEISFNNFALAVSSLATDNACNMESGTSGAFFCGFAYKVHAIAAIKKTVLIGSALTIRENYGVSIQFQI